MNNLSSIDFTKVIEDAFGETKEEFKNYQQQQMFFGKGRDGKNIQRVDRRYEVYAPLTEFIKAEKRQPFDRVTLRDTGSFYRNMLIKPSVGKVVITSTDDKTGSLIERYGENIFGLNVDYASVYAQNDMGPVATKNITELIHK